MRVTAITSVWIAFLGMILLAVVLLVTGPSKGRCSACIGQFCGSSSECPTGCFCAKEMGQPTGRCLGD